MSMLTRADHDDIIGAHSLPTFVIASKKSEHRPINNNEQASLLDDVWYVCTDDPLFRKNAIVEIDFTVAVDFGGVRLNSESQMHDLITAKIIAIEHLLGQTVEAVSANHLKALVGQWAWIVRWRLGLGIKQTSDITHDLFKGYLDLLRSSGGDFRATVPLEDRLETLERRVRDGEWKWPTRRLGSGEHALQFGTLAAELGCLAINIERQSAIRSLIEDTVSTTSHGISITTYYKRKNKKSEKRRTGDKTANLVIKIWRVLRDLSKDGLLDHDPISFNPFIELSAREIANSFSTDIGGRIGTVPPPQLLSLLNGAATWALDYSPHLLEIWDTIESVDWNTSSHARQKNVKPEVKKAILKAITAAPGLPTIAPVLKRSRWELGDNVLTLGETIALLATSCIILIGAFGARRKIEIESLRTGCVTTDVLGECWISSYIAKTIRNFERLPVPRCVRRAAEVLEHLSRSSRKETNTDWLIQILNPSRPEATTKPNIGLVDINALLNRFANVVSVPLLPDGSTWNFTTHQLRRGFAIYYYYGNIYASLDALSRFLRHFDPEMTRRYITDETIGSLMRLREEMEARIQEAVEREWTKKEIKFALLAAKDRMNDFEGIRRDAMVGHMLDMVDGIEHPIGLGAHRLRDELEQMIEDARSSVRMKSRSNSPDVERTELIALLRKHAPRRRLEPHPAGHAHCGCDWGVQEQLAQAKCLQVKQAELGTTGDMRPDYAYARDVDCIDCVHCVAFQNNQKVIERKLAEATMAAELAPSEGTRISAQRRLAELMAGVARAKEATERSA